MRSPTWWLRRAAAEAAAATDPKLRADLLDDIATYTGAARDPRGFAAAVDHVVQRLAEVQDPAERALSALNFARLVSRLGTAEQIRRVVALGEDAATKVEDVARGEAFLSDFASVRADTADAAGALAAVGRLTNVVARADASINLAAALGARGDRANYGQAVRLAQQCISAVKDPRAASGLLVRLVEAQVRGGDDAGARQTAIRLRDPFFQGYATLALARSKTAPAATRAKDLDAATALAAGVQDVRRADLLADIAAARSDAGDREGARRTLDAAGQSVLTLLRDQRPAFLAVARAWDQAGDKPAALAMVRRAEQATRRPGEATRPADLLAIAQAYRDLGDAPSAARALDAARAAVAAEPPPAARLADYEALAAADARAGDLARWRQDLASAEKALEQARQAEQTKPANPGNPNPPSPTLPPAQTWREMATAAAVREAAGAGKEQEARQLLAQVTDAEARTSLTAEAALAAAEHGEWAASRALAAGLPLADRANVCNTAGYRAARTGKPDEAARQAALYATPEERGNVDTGVAQGLLEEQFGLPPVAEGR